jgi:myo-inositol-1(or 4)-monophosphatase
MEKGNIVQGVVYNPALDEMFWAELGQGAYLNGEPIKNPDLPFAETVFGIGSSPYNASLREPTLDMIREIMKKCDIRCHGSAALDLCYVANGQQGGYFEYEINPWDIAAGLLIAREAGAIVTTMDGQEPPLDRKLTILAAGPKIYEEIREILKF